MAAIRTGAGRFGCPSTISIIEALHALHKFYGDDYQVECPTGSGTFLTLEGVALWSSLVACRRLFAKEPDRTAAVSGDSRRQWEDVNFRDRLLFNKYFHGDTGRGLGASHQTGWTGLIALLFDPRETQDTAGVAPAATPNADVSKS